MRGHVVAAHATATRKQLKVAVIGAGAGGLVAARELLREGHHVKVLEQGSVNGGVWQLDSRVEEDDLLGRNPRRRCVHGSMYDGLRTNLPREVMSFADLPFVPAFMNGTSRDARRFCGHDEVLRYLRHFADVHGLQRVTTFNTRVVSVRRTDADTHADRSRRSSQDDASGSSSESTGETQGGENGAHSDLGSAARDVTCQWLVTTEPSHGEGPAVGPEAPDTTASASSDDVIRRMALAARLGSEVRRSGAGSAAPSQSPTNSLQTVSQLSAGAEAAAADLRAGLHTEQFDAVVICNGHYTEPRVPDVPGMADFPGLCMHSHNYRRPQPFEGLRVLLVGAHASGEDIAREVSTAADAVFLSAASWARPEWATDRAPYGPRKNITRAALLSSLEHNGDVVFQDGGRVERVDVVMFCTGYQYDVPFLEPGIVDCSNSNISPLYQHLFTPALGPGLSFVGLPFQVSPFPLMEYQCKLIARMLSGRAATPSRAELEAWCTAHYARLKAEGVPERHFHRFKLAGSAWEYQDWMAGMCGPDVPLTPPWQHEMYEHAAILRREFPDDYRDRWPDDVLVQAFNATLPAS